MRILVSILTLGLLLAPLSGYGDEAFLRAQIEELDLQGTFDGVESSLVVQNANTGEVVYSRNEAALFNPASNAKILSTLAALSYLTPDFRFKTQLIGGSDRQDPKKKKKAKQDKSKKMTKVGKDGMVPILTLKGYGDPSFTSYDLEKMVRELKKKGVRRVGEVRIDETYFDNTGFPGREDGFRQRLFNVGAFFLDQNQIEVVVTPGESIGLPATVSLYPPVEPLVCEGEILTRARGSKVTVRQAFGFQSGLGLHVSGAVALGSDPQTFSVPCDEPGKVAGQRLLVLLRQFGIEAPDRFRFAPTPDDGKILVENKSTALKDLLPIINKKSDNFLAEQITKVLGAEYFGQPGSTRKGVEAIYRELNATGVDVTGIYLENGSGLSRNSLVKARSLVSSLQKVYDNPRLREPFIETLSVLGVDGTLRRRFRNTDFEGRFVGKTGTLNGVSALTGFAYPITGSGGKLYILSHLINGSGKGFWQRKQMTQKFLELLLSQ